MSKRVRSSQDGRRQAVIFDFDGTIADSFEYVFDFLKKEAGNTTNYSPKELEELRKMSMKDLSLYLGVPVWRLLVTYFRGRRVMRSHMEYVQPYEGMVDVIRQLHQDGVLLFITSANSSHNIRHMLRTQGVLSCFRAIRSSAGITGKPALIRQLLIRYRLPKARTWYVGDEVGDILAADRAGVHSLAVTWGFADPQKLREMRPNGVATVPSDISRITEVLWK
jgi:phosphoglycolate phosphatase